jgi:dolichol-phosphate mannosyltransferase
MKSGTVRTVTKAQQRLGDAGGTNSGKSCQGKTDPGPSAAPAGQVAVIIPTYNERDNIEAIIDRVRTSVPEADVLVVDDNSPDGTGELAEKLAAGDSHIHLLRRPGKSGLGAAYIAGFRWALDLGYASVVQMDADGSHQPEQLPDLLTTLAHADVVIGSRWVPGGEVVNWPRSRQLLSRAGNMYARLVLRIRIHDATAGYRAYRDTTLRRIPLGEVQSQGYCFQVDLTLRALRAGMAVVETPITFVERASGTSKMSKTIIAEALWRITRWGITSRQEPQADPLPTPATSNSLTR